MSILDMAVPAENAVESINALVYGESGSGKTYLSGTGRENGKNDLIIDLEGGTITNAAAGSDVNVLRVKTYEELLKVIEALEENPERFEWVTVDSLSKVQEFIWEYILDAERSGRNPSRSKYRKELQEWGEAQERFKEIISRLKACDANVIHLVRSELDIDEESQEFQRPAVHGKQGVISQWVCGEMDLVGYLRVAEKDGRQYRRIEFNKQPEFWAKDRFGIFAKPQANMTLERLTDILLAASKKKKKDTKEEGK